MRVGIIGLGSFGQLAAKTLARDRSLEVLAYDVGKVDALPENTRLASAQEVATSDVVVLCVPLRAYDDVLSSLQPRLSPTTLVVDICSVKVEAEKRLRAGLPGHENLLITHPMFGPQTAKDGFVGLPLVVCAAEGKAAEQALQYCAEKLQLKIVRMTSEEHDREMANVHALTFFIGRGLTNFGLKESAFAPPSFKWLLDLSALDKVHTQDLFQTMEVGNPYAKSAREKFVRTLQNISQELEKGKI